MRCKVFYNRYLYIMVDNSIVKKGYFVCVKIMYWKDVCVVFI